MKKLAIIIVNYKTYDFTIQCVESILSNSTVESDIFIVDNCSNNESAKVLMERYENYKNISVLCSPENKGYSAGLNYGLKCAGIENYEFFAFLNNDLFFQPGVFEQLISTFSQFPCVGIVGGQIVDVNGNRQKSYKYRLTFIKHLLDTKPFNYFVTPAEDKDKYDYQECLVFDGMVHGCCFVIPRFVMSQLGKLDDNIFIYYEEDALSNVIFDMGLKCVLNPSAKIVHVGSQTISRSAFTYFQRYRSALYVLNRYCRTKKWQLFLIYAIYRISLLTKWHCGSAYIDAFHNMKKVYCSIVSGGER